MKSAGAGSVLAHFRRMGLLLAAAIFPLMAEPGAATAADTDSHALAWSETALPSPGLAPEEVVRIQLRALRENDETNEGIAIAFRFASPRNKASTGPLPRFIQMIKAGPYRLMLEFEHASYTATRVQGDHAVQRVTLVGPRQIRTYDFLLQRQAGPPCDGCWMTEVVVIVPGVESAV